MSEELPIKEEKAIEIVQDLINQTKENVKNNIENLSENRITNRILGYRALETLLDLYQKEKEKNKWKPISEYNREKYDWVLVKYFDGDYECVPEVAEKRSDGKWYTSEREIPFEVKYFFDMQELLEERN